MNSVGIPYIPETAPFTAEQRAWLNGFLAGLFSQVPQGTVAGKIDSGVPPKTGEPLLIMYGSQTGTAEGLAKKFARQSEGRGFSPIVLPLNDYEKGNLPIAKRLIVISSTWGEGDPPDNAANFWTWLNSETAPRLENIEYAVLGLGDRNYMDFCGASKKFDSRLQQLGAKRMVERGECDVDYESAANAWIENVWPKLKVNGQSVPIVTNGHGRVEERNGSTASPYNKKNPFPARLLKNRLLNKPGSAKEVRHYEISLAESNLTYSVGDALGVYPKNCPQLVDEIVASSSSKGDELIEINGTKITFRESLESHFDVCRASTELISAVAKAAPNSELSALLSPERPADLKRWLWGRDVLDLLKLFPAPISATALVPLLRRISPRLYSISSSPNAHPGEVHLTVSTVRYESFGRERKGVASCFLADRCGEGPTNVFVQCSPGFKPPQADRPMIMVGPGTGIAPFRAFLEEREAAAAKGRNWLFFGDQKRATDFLYEEQLTGWADSGHLTHLDLAFSRDQEEKIYVQHRLLEKAAEVWSWLEDGAHFYVCGDASRMAADVDRALHRVIEKAGGKKPDEAAAYVAKLKTEKRYQRDIY